MCLPFNRLAGLLFLIQVLIQHFLDIHLFFNIFDQAGGIDCLDDRMGTDLLFSIRLTRPTTKNHDL